MKKTKMSEKSVKSTVDHLNQLIRDVKAGNLTGLLLVATVDVGKDSTGLYETRFFEDLGAFAHIEVLAKSSLEQQRGIFEKIILSKGCQDAPAPAPVPVPAPAKATRAK